MPSKMQQRIQHAHERGCHVFRLYIPTDRITGPQWAVYVEDEHDFRGPMSKRAAKNLAYAISISKHYKLEVTIG